MTKLSYKLTGTSLKLFKNFAFIYRIENLSRILHLNLSRGGGVKMTPGVVLTPCRDFYKIIFGASERA